MFLFEISSLSVSGDNVALYISRDVSADTAIGALVTGDFRAFNRHVLKQTAETLTSTKVARSCPSCLIAPAPRATGAISRSSSRETQRIVRAGIWRWST